MNERLNLMCPALGCDDALSDRYSLYGWLRLYLEADGDLSSGALRGIDGYAYIEQYFRKQHADSALIDPAVPAALAGHKSALLDCLCGLQERCGHPELADIIGSFRDVAAAGEILLHAVQRYNQTVLDGSTTHIPGLTLLCRMEAAERVLLERLTDWCRRSIRSGFAADGSENVR